MESPKNRKPVQQLAKLSRPQLRSVYSRTRLFEQLDNSRPITWITAPPGSGKTTLVSSYLESRKLTTLWYQIDLRDEDAPTLFHYLALAVKQNWPRTRQTFPALSPEYNLGLEVFTLNYFEKLYGLFKKPGVLVFDNYQELNNDSVTHQLLAKALEYIPPHLKVIVISRSAVHERYLRLKLNNQLTEITRQALALDLEEAQGIVKLHAVNTTKLENSAHILKQTRGWAAGFVLALESLNQNTLKIDQIDNLTLTDVFNYFAGEIFSQLNKETQEQLLYSAFLPKITSEQLAELSQHKNDSLLEDLAQRNYFTVSHPGQPTIYEFHPLFREFLVNQTEKYWDKTKIHQVKLTSAQLLQDSLKIEDAITLYIDLQQWLSAAALLEVQSQAFIDEGRQGLLGQWLLLCSENLTESRPWISYWLARCQLLKNPYQGIETFILAYTGFETSNNTRGLLLAWAGAVDAICLAQQDFSTLDPWLVKLENIISKNAWPNQELKAQIIASSLFAISWYAPTHKLAQLIVQQAQELVKTPLSSSLRAQLLMHLNTFNWFAGKIKYVVMSGQQLNALKDGEDIGPLEKLYIMSTMAIVSFNQGKIGYVKQQSEEALALAKETGIYVMDARSYIASIYATLINGDDKQVELLLHKLEEVLAVRSNNLELARYYALQSWYALKVGEYTIAASHAENGFNLAKQVGAPSGQFYCSIGRAICQIELADYNGAKQELALAAKINASSSESFNFIFHITSAHLYYCLNELPTVIQHMNAAIDLSRAGMVLCFFWRSEVMTKLFTVMLENRCQVSYIQQWIKRSHLIAEKPPLHLDNWPYPIKIFTLGRFSLLIDDEPQAFTAKSAQKPMELLKCLIAFGGRQVSQENITEALWPDAEGDSARRNLDTTLFRLRKLLKHEQALVLKEGLLSLNSKYIWVDNWAAERLLSQLEDLLHRTDINKIEALQHKLITFYNGDFLGFETDRPWSIVQKERLCNRMLKGLLQLGAFWQAQDHFEHAEICYKKGLTLDPLHEPFYQQLIQLNLAQDKKSQAASTYEQCRKMLSTQLGVMPSEETMRLYNQIKNKI